MNDVERQGSAEEEGLGALFSRVIADAENLARAEIELQKAKIVARIDDARNGVLLLLASVATGSVALTALVVGVLMVLTPLVGPGLATAIVVGTLLLLSALLGWLAMRHFKLLFGASEDAS
ncbi:phage holin family protein [Sphingomonas sp. MMS24-J45]|uniref:phage holin family protein n=1 Tax=Sphingomonas sp. MMS24-J45 TaxID=3238806 RepID=UPI00384C0A93